VARGGMKSGLAFYPAACAPIIVAEHTIKASFVYVKSGGEVLLLSSHHLGGIVQAPWGWSGLSLLKRSASAAPTPVQLLPKSD
jgi:hypothetical protein